ncbi:hypothetical protein QKD39_gp34 [Psittacine adenovirus 1]|uniref:Uncharacterized protein n=1 Tax=Psittacine adenovirus 1 TaxID=318592 RepID=A0A2Z5E026_9ADEN|nr:hypothetical protein QKD39_gp34 [Psittacine adenovirus 1]AXB73008.1 hypothetical protein [Psittacine adenovirus 1]
MPLRRWSTDHLLSAAASAPGIARGGTDSTHLLAQGSIRLPDACATRACPPPFRIRSLSA